MKRVKGATAFLLVFGMLFSLVGCESTAGNADSQSAQIESGQENAVEEDKIEPEAELEEVEQMDSNPLEQSSEAEGADSNILVVFFSRTGEQYTVGVIDKGNTAIVAEMIADQTGADLWEVLPVDDIYPTDSYDDLIDVAKKEQNDNARPAYKGEVPDLSQYDTVFIGAPVWWGDWPMTMYTFFEKNQDGLSGKKLLPFSTHEGSGLSGFDSKLASVCSDSEVLDGLAVRGNDTQNNQEGVRNTVNDWLSDFGY